jgi:hypothetical protein
MASINVDALELTEEGQQALRAIIYISYFRAAFPRLWAGAEWTAHFGDKAKSWTSTAVRRLLREYLQEELLELFPELPP